MARKRKYATPEDRVAAARQRQRDMRRARGQLSVEEYKATLAAKRMSPEEKAERKRQWYRDYWARKRADLGRTPGDGRMYNGRLCKPAGATVKAKAQGKGAIDGRGLKGPVQVDTTRQRQSYEEWVAAGNQPEVLPGLKQSSVFPGRRPSGVVW